MVTASFAPDRTRPTDQNAVRSPRAGFVVSKAVGGAVVRNRVKRRLRAIMAARLAEPALAETAAMIQVRALPAAADADYATLEAELSSALRQCVKQHRSRSERA